MNQYAAFMTDLIVKAGHSRTLAGDATVAGWVEIAGTLVCEGDLACLGVSVEPGGTLACKNLVANVVEVDNLGGNAQLEAATVRARFVSLVQVTKGPVSEPTRLVADYVHHDAGDLNPSFDYERGERGIVRPFVRGRKPPLDIDARGLRRLLCEGRNPFVGRGLLVERAVAPQREAPAPSPLADELAAWLAAHPGPQRRLFGDLKAAWTERLAGCCDPAAACAIARAVASPKLASERDTWLAGLGLLPAKKSAAAPVVDSSERRDAVVVRRDPPRDPGAWLERLALGATSLDITDGSVAELPPRIARYTELVRIQLAYNRLAWLPPELCTLPKLASLDVRNNRLTELPAELGRLATLTTLVVEGNEGLAALPESLCELENLAELAIGHTAIARLPEQIGRLVSLRHLNLSGCQRLVSLPASFFTLPRLDSIYLHGTRLPSATLARIRAAFPAADYWNFQI